MQDVTTIHFRDLQLRQQAETDGLTDRKQQLENLKKNRPGLNSDEVKDLARIEAILDAVKRNHELCDPLFVAVRDLFNANIGILGFRLLRHDCGKLVFGNQAGCATGAAGADSVAAAGVRAALTLGLVMKDGLKPAPVIVDSGLIYTDRNAKPEYGNQSRAFFKAIGDTHSFFELAMLVLPLLAQEGDPDLDPDTPSVVDAAEFAAVMRYLEAKGITTAEPQLRRRVNEALNGVQRVGAADGAPALSIDLPDLDGTADIDIVSDNVRLMGPMIYAAMFDELKAFQVVEKLVELFQHGMLPTGNSAAGRLLYDYWREAPNRMSEAERKNFYAMTMGIPGGDANGMVNRDFNDLWIRFVASVSSFVRQNEVDKLLRAHLPSAANGQQVRKAARDLASNLSLHGYGMAFYAALDLQHQIRTIIDLLSDPVIKSAYGARDMWQVIDQVATLELGGAKTSARYRTLATCGAIITAWLANRVEKIMSPAGPLIDLSQVLAPLPPTAGRKATSDPTDFDLVNACELWLADTAIGDTRVDELSQPREAPVMTSRPVQIPTFARDMLDSVGVGMGMNYANAGAGRH